jgi:hypothetical protein
VLSRFNFVAFVILAATVKTADWTADWTADRSSGQIELSGAFGDSPIIADQGSEISPLQYI